MSRFSPTESLSVTIILSKTVVPIGASSKTSTSYGTCGGVGGNKMDTERGNE